MEVSQPKHELRKATTALTSARTLLHSFPVEPVGKALVEGQKSRGTCRKRPIGAGGTRLSEGMLSASLVPILIVVGLLLLCIRTLPPPKSPPDSL